MKMILDLHDSGEFFTVSNVYLAEELNNDSVDRKLDREIKDATLFAEIADLLDSNAIVKLPKNKEILLENLVVDKLNSLESSKIRASSEVRNILNNHISEIDIFDFYKYTKTNNILNSAKYTITSANQSDQQTAINNITSDSVKLPLLNAFNELVACSANIETKRQVFTDAVTTLQEIEDATTETDVQTVLDTFTKKYQ